MRASIEKLCDYINGINTTAYINHEENEKVFIDRSLNE